MRKIGGMQKLDEKERVKLDIEHFPQEITANNTIFFALASNFYFNIPSAAT